MKGFTEKGFTGLIEETKSTNRLVFYDAKHKDPFFVSNNAFNTLAQRIDCDGKTLSHNCVERDLFLQKMMNINMVSTMVVKHFDGAAKVFAMMSDKYAQVPLDVLTLITDHLSKENSLGKPECLGWFIEHTKVTIIFKFEEYADDVSLAYNLPKRMVPVVTLMSSDIGECSVIAKGAWLTQYGDTVPDMEYVREHRGKVNSQQILKEVQEKVFDKFTTLPERLADLMSMEVTPAGCDLSSAAGQAENRKNVYDTFYWVFGKVGIANILGKTRFAELMECIDFGINETRHYDAYDIATECFSLPSQLQAYLAQSNIGEGTLLKLQKAFAEVPYLNFQERHSKKKAAPSEEGKLFLTPGV